VDGLGGAEQEIAHPPIVPATAAVRRRSGRDEEP
jgi:hypothetical protein